MKLLFAIVQNDDQKSLTYALIDRNISVTRIASTGGFLRGGNSTLMIGVEWLMKNGLFSWWEEHVPDWVNRIFPAELMSIVAAQMGGLVQAAGVAANLRSHGMVTSSQILLAMLVASAIGNPIRALRRNLPSAMGIFPTRDALTIVVVMQLSRMIGAILLIALTGLFIHYTH